MSLGQYLEMADRCSRLAQGCTDPAMTERLTVLAVGYLEMAAVLRDANPVRPQQSQPPHKTDED